MLAAVVAGGMVLLAGDFQAYLVVVGAMGAVVLVGPGWRGRLRPALLLVVLSGIGGCVQWLPGMLAGPGSAHLGRMTMERAQWNSLHPLQVLDTAFGPIYGGRFEDELSVFVAQRLFGTGLGSAWTLSTYAGPVVIGLALVGAWGSKVRGWLLAAGALVLMLALGRHTPLYGLLYRWLPGWDAFRYPMKLFPFLMVLLVVCAGAGLDRAAREPGVARALRLGWLAVAAVAVGVLALEWRGGIPTGLILHSVQGSAPGGLEERLSAALLSASFRIAVVLLLSALVLSGWVPGRLRRPLLLLLVVVDLALANAARYEVVPRDAVREPPTAEVILGATPRDPLHRPRMSTAVEQFVVGAPRNADPTTALVRARIMALENMSQSLWGLESSDAILPLESWWLWKLGEDKQWWVLTGHRLFSVGALLS